MLRRVYNFILTISLPFLFLRLYWRGFRAPLYRRRWMERLGVFNAPKTTGGLWIHAVSVGEATAASPIVNQFKKAYPKLPITVTTTTPTGSKSVKRLFGESVFHVYLPFDLPWTIERFLQKVRPDVAVIMETEIWPNLMFYLKKKNIPTILANARLSEKSQKGYKVFKNFSKQIMNSFTTIAAQAKEDGQRFLELGLDPKKLVVTGSVKFDINIFDQNDRAFKLRQMLGSSRNVLIAASTHEKEEEQVLEAFKKIKKVFPKSLLILVPRHPERFNKVASLIEEYGFKLGRRTVVSSYSPDVDVFLGDTMGELNLFYSSADCAFVGGSLVPVGGHNVLEPASLGVPVISGPYVHNFAKITNILVEAGAMSLIKSASDLASLVINWFHDAELIAKTGEKGKEIVAQNKGATDKLIKMISEHLRQSTIKSIKVY